MKFFMNLIPAPFCCLSLGALTEKEQNSETQFYARNFAFFLDLLGALPTNPFRGGLCQRV